MPLIQLFATLFLLVGQTTDHPGDGRVLDPRMHHLGDDQVEKWAHVAVAAEGPRLEVVFTARARAAESVLVLDQEDIHDVWTIELNGRAVSRLKRVQEARTERYLLPPDSLVDGENRLSFFADKPSDDVLLGRIRLHERTLREVLDLLPLLVTVADASTGSGVPARVTLAGATGQPVELFYGATERTAVRPGVVYARDGHALVEVPPGEYTVYATRGMEWSRDRATVRVARAGAPNRVDLAIRREVDTRGFVAADTHVHTVTHSGHGDATVEERLVTLAGEGIELAIATDHNHNTDYRPLQRALGMQEYFTPITGNEVTTEVGHFNAFPLDPLDPIPDHKSTDWVALVDGMRARGARVVILNHPRWPSDAEGPFGQFQFDPVSGRFAGGRVLPVDALELVNSSWLLEDPYQKFRDWFGLLNGGQRISSVGSSDSHTVGAPVGQGRTYVRSSTDDPAAIDPTEVVDAFARGDTSVSLGIFAEARVDDVYLMGAIVPCGAETVSLSLRVAAPSFVTPRTVTVFQNGEKLFERALDPTPGRPTDETLSFTLPRPEHDAYIVCSVLGDPITEPCWATDGPYTIAATNPIYLDADRDGRIQSPRALAAELLERTPAAELRELLEGASVPVAVHVLALLVERAEPGTIPRLRALLEADPPLRTDLAPHVRRLLDS